MIKVASLFDGIGGTPLCATLCGAEPVWASEIDEFPIKVTKHHFPKMKHYGDICKINGAEVEPVDIIVGGSPCQDLSVAGQRKGMKHSDFGDEEATRSGLFMEQVRIVKEMRDGTDGLFPRFMVWENVPGAFSSKGSGDSLEAGEAFRIVLEETARIADPTVRISRPPEGWFNSGSILGDGFSISWRTVDAQYWGVPQRRRRIYLVADFGGESAPEILFERESLSWHFEKSISEGQGTPGEIADCTGATGTFVKSTRAKEKDGEEKWVESDIAPTQNAFDMGDVRATTICIQPLVYENHPADSRVTGPHTVCPSATSRWGTGGGNVPFVQEPAYTMLMHNSTVRRLTPLECERLQGYPDGWTNIPGATDSARYKSLGNSFAIPNALFVISGCIEAIERSEA